MMRTPCILSTLLLANACCFAQSRAFVPAATSTGHERTTAIARAKPEKPGTAGTAKSSISDMGEAANVYTILLDGQNQVHYDPDINTMVFVHRQNPSGFGNQGGTGTLRFGLSTDGGASWTLNHLLTPDLFNGSADTIVGVRYPSGAIYNPPGNTDPLGAYVVSTGMALNTIDTDLELVNTGFLQRSSAKLDGTAGTDTFTDFYGDRTTHGAYGLCRTPDGVLWALSSRQSNSTLNEDTVSFKDFRVNKGIWNSTTQQVDWSDAATIAPNTLVYNDPSGDGSKNVLIVDWNLAYSPDGQTGFAVILAKEYDGIQCGPMPLVWRTTDGGENWSQLPNHDFSQEQWVIDNIYGASDTDVPRPYFAAMDITVDANDRLHIVADVLSQYYGNSADSVNYIFTALESQFLVHCSTTDGSDWTIGKLSDKYMEDYEYPVEIVDPPGPFMDFRPQASRTADGSHVFFTWNRSAEGEEFNLFPEIHGIGYNATTDLWTGPRSLSAGTDADAVAWWQTVSPVCITGGDEYDYELPTVFADPGPYADNPSGFTYIKGIGFDESEFIVGLNEIGSTGSVAVYPNPGDGLFTISLSGLGVAQLSVRDMTGREVNSLRTNAARSVLDLGAEAPGIYTLTATSDGGARATARIVLR